MPQSTLSNLAHTLCSLSLIGGTGMTPEVMAKAFDPFFAIKSVGKGTGLGLSQVFGVVKQSNGHIKIDSEVSHGTTIKVYLPRFHGIANASELTTAEDAALPSGHELVLLVDDDEQVLSLTAAARSYRGALRGRGVGCAHMNPEIRLLFTDVVMPGMNGRGLAEEALQRRPDLKVLFTTGYSRNATVHNGVLDPGVNLLQKPASLEQLAAKVRAVLDS